MFIKSISMIITSFMLVSVSNVSFGRERLSDYEKKLQIKCVKSTEKVQKLCNKNPSSYDCLYTKQFISKCVEFIVNARNGYSFTEHLEC